MKNKSQDYVYSHEREYGLYHKHSYEGYRLVKEINNNKWDHEIVENDRMKTQTLFT
jgi:hypothetical protein